MSNESDETLEQIPNMETGEGTSDKFQPILYAINKLNERFDSLEKRLDGFDVQFGLSVKELF